jgi:hypothetical protein
MIARFDGDCEEVWTRKDSDKVLRARDVPTKTIGWLPPKIVLE